MVNFSTAVNGEIGLSQDTILSEVFVKLKTIMDYRDEADSLSDTLDPLNFTPKERSISGLIVASSALIVYYSN